MIGSSHGKALAQKQVEIIASFLIGFVGFITLFGFSTLNPTNVDWIYIRGGDALQHQLGWMAYRIEPWTWKFGEISSLLYPSGTSIVYTDSIPVFAVLFKTIRGILPNQFQYLGWWTLVCWILNIHVAYRLFRLINFRKIIAYLSSLLLSISPLLVDRAFHHDALTAHWLIFGSIFLLITQIQGNKLRKSWIFVVTLSFWIHAYLFAMVLLFYLFGVIYEILINRRYKTVIQSIVLITVICLASGYVLGVFDSPADLRSKNIAHYSANINTLINPLNTSTFFKSLPISFEGQYEGYAYLGIGIILLFVFSFIINPRNIYKPPIFKYLPVLLPVFIMAIFSTGGSLTLGDLIIYKIPLPDAIHKIFLIFRSNGRFIWPAYYLIVIFILYLASKSRITRWLIVGVIALQFWEIQPLLQQKDYIHRDNYQSPLSSGFWDIADAHYQHIFILPEDDIRNIYMPFGIYAIQNDMTINWMYLARMDSRALRIYFDDIRGEVITGNLDTDTVYISNNQKTINAIQRKSQQSVVICRENDYWIILNEPEMDQVIRQSLQSCSP